MDIVLDDKVTICLQRLQNAPVRPLAAVKDAADDDDDDISRLLFTNFRCINMSSKNETKYTK